MIEPVFPGQTRTPTSNVFGDEHTVYIMQDNEVEVTVEVVYSISVGVKIRMRGKRTEACSSILFFVIL
jgi:hypothetical protein